MALGPILPSAQAKIPLPTVETPTSPFNYCWTYLDLKTGKLYDQYAYCGDTMPIDADSLFVGIKRDMATNQCLAVARMKPVQVAGLDGRWVLHDHEYPDLVSCHDSQAPGFRWHTAMHMNSVPWCDSPGGAKTSACGCQILVDTENQLITASWYAGGRCGQLPALQAADNRERYQQYCRAFPIEPTASIVKG